MPLRRYAVKNSSKFFANRECEYYPCHKIEEQNCLFCYCPLYNLDCPGTPKMIDKNGKLIKSCADCTFPHRAENYERIMQILKDRNKKQEP